MKITIDRSPDLTPVFMIGIDDLFLDYEFDYENLLELQKAISEAIEFERQRMN